MNEFYEECGTVQVVAPDGTVLFTAANYALPIPGWYPSVECVAAMVSEEA